VDEAKSLGLRIVHILANRLQATVQIENDHGGVVTIAFPLHGDAPVEPRAE
jgi:two-component sensor histidine kinase